jgi:hypothetical protein
VVPLVLPAYYVRTGVERASFRALDEEDGSLDADGAVEGEGAGGQRLVSIDLGQVKAELGVTDLVEGGLFPTPADFRYLHRFAMSGEEDGRVVLPLCLLLKIYHLLILVC